MQTPHRTVALVAALLLPGLVGLFGCAPARYYDSLKLNGFYFGEEGQKVYAAAVPGLLRQRRVRRLEVISKAARHLVLERRGAAPDLRGLLPEALMAVYWLLTYPLRGAELDQLVPIGNNLLAPVTTLFEPDGSIVAIVGSPLPFDPDAAFREFATAEIKDRYGITVAEPGSVAWDHEELTALGLAIGLLKPSEMAVVSKVPVVREHWPTRERNNRDRRDKRPGETQASVVRKYHEGRIEQQIELYDSAFSEDISSFCGTPDRPLPTSTRHILHEFGHLIANEPVRAMILQWKTQSDEFDGYLRELKATHSGSLEKLPPAIEEDLVQRLRHQRALGNRLHRMLDSSPVLIAFQQARSQPNGPTPYGATSLEESFAESFALFRCDPAALRRVDPAATEWFAKEGHLTAMADAAH